MVKRGKLQGRIGLIACGAVLVALVAAGFAFAAADNIVAIAPNKFSVATYNMAQGEQPVFQNQEAGVTHNVTASANGPDGKALFRTADIPGGGAAKVDGTQYLTAGSYVFICTIHPSTMIATLAVSGNGTPQARPALGLRVTTHKIAKVIKQGLLISIDSNVKTDDVELEAKLGNTVIGKEVDQSLTSGNQVFRVKLSKAGKSKLAKKTKATITVTGTLPFGAPTTVKAKLK